MTAIKGMTWVYKEIYLATDNPDMYISTAGWDDNPWLLEDQKVRMGRGLNPQALQVRREGKFVRHTGLVCAWFDRSIHVIDMPDLPEGDTFFGLDFGFTNPSAGLWVRIDRQFNWWIFDGFYRRHMTNPNIRKLIKVKEAGIEGRIRRIGDSAQASDIKQLCDEGVSIVGVEKATGTSKENWDEWRARLMQNHGEINEKTGKPKIFISKDLVDTDDDETSRTFGDTFNFLVHEIENLRWEENKDVDVSAQAAWGKQPKHAIDALTYIMASITQPARAKRKKSQSTGARRGRGLRGV